MPPENTSKRDKLTEIKDGKTTRKATKTDAHKIQPTVIAVEGLFVDDDGLRYEVDKMGNMISAEEPKQHNEQRDPLTEAKNTKEKVNTDDRLSVEDLSENAESNSSANNKGNVDESDSILPTNRTKPNNLKESKNGKKSENNNRAKENGSKDNIEVKADGADETDKRKKEEDVVVMVASRDDVDAASTYSLFMEKDFRYYFQHPYCRLFISYFVVFCNFLIYAEDPVAHSRKECLIPMIGNDVAFVLTRYPPNAWSLLKVVFWLIGLVVGMFVGKLLVHGLLFNRLFRLKMFNDSQGSWMIMFLICLITIFIMSCFYNLFLMIGGDSTNDWRISDLMGVRNDVFMKVAACGTWCGDFFTAWMVTDIMLQEKLYPGWARPIRTWWKRGYNRIILFWIVVVITSFIVIFVIATDYIQWDKLNRDFLPTNEVSRAFLASFILVMDLLIVMQDWDFPHFMSAIDIKLPGLNTAHIQFSIPKFLKRETWDVHITGKWFNYGILFLVMLLDLNMWKNQLFYKPYDYGQYVNDEGRIYTVQDDYSLENFNETQITYAYRSVTINEATNATYVSGDTHMHTKYLDYAVGIKGIAFIPSIACFIVFGVLIWMFGRFKPTTTDPYGGRLKKRIKKRFSFRLPWQRRDEIRRKIHAVPKLLYFKRKGGKGEEKTETVIPTTGFTETGGIEDKEATVEQ